MNKQLVQNCWDIIRDIEPHILNDPRLPLTHLDDCLAYFQLPLMPLAKADSGDLPDVLGAVAPSFKGLTDDLLVALRRDVLSGTKSSVAAQWAEKLMRFCEVRYRSLKTRSVAKCVTQDAAQLHQLQLAAFLMDQAIATRDLRLLNTVLKLADLKWILNRKTIDRNLRRKDGHCIAALFQFRIILTTESIVDRLSGGETL